LYNLGPCFMPLLFYYLVASPGHPNCFVQKRTLQVEVKTTTKAENMKVCEVFQDLEYYMIIE
jgi:hypothetical protein